MEATDGDESFSLRAATIIMAVVAFLTLMASLYGVDPFTGIFNGLIVYTPAFALIVALLLDLIKRRLKENARPRSENAGAPSMGA